MPIPSPRSGEKQKEFIRRCMGDPTMISEYPQTDQRFAVCQTEWEEKN